MKRTVSILALFCVLQGALVWVCFGHGGAALFSRSKEKDKEIALVTYSYSDSYFYREFASVITEYCKDTDYSVLILDGEAKSETQILEVEALIAKRVSAIIIDPVEPKALDDILKRAMDAGIRIVDLGKRVQYYDVFYAYDDYSSGYKLGAAAACWINNKLGGTGKVALFVSSDLVNLKEREAGIREALEALSPGAEITHKISAIDQYSAYTVAETLFDSGIGPNAILCVNDDGALGALEAAEYRRLSCDQFFLGSVDGTTAILKEIETAPFCMTTITLSPQSLAASSIRAAIDLLEGRSPESFSHHSYYITRNNLDFYYSW